MRFIGAGMIVAGGEDGKLRMWNVRSPDRPVWCVDTGTRLMAVEQLSPSIIAAFSRSGLVTVRGFAAITPAQP